MQLTDHPADQVALIQYGGASITFGELDDRSARLADHFASLGLKTGDHIAIVMDNRLEFIETCWAAQRSGLYYTPVNWHLTAGEAAYVVADCGARVLVGSMALGDLVGGIADTTPALEAVLIVGDGGREGWTAYEDAARGPRTDAHEAVEGSYFFYSSGTTGRPKGIKQTNEFPPYGTGVRLDLLAQMFGVVTGATYLSPAPLYHAAPLGWTMSALRNGATAVIMDRFEPDTLLAAIGEHQVTHMQVVPTMFVRLLKLPADQRDAAVLKTLKMVLHAGAPCPVEVKAAMIEWFGPILIEYYAGSEGVGMTLIDSPQWLEHRGSVGRPLAGSVHVLGPDGTEMPPGEVGLVYFADGGTFEYHNDPAKTASTFNDRGWATLGDLGHLDADGYLYLSDRRTDLILSGGVNIYPQEIEDALVMHPAVADVAVIGVADAEMGEQVHAVVQLAEGVALTPEIEAELRAHCRENLAGFKCPRSMAFVGELPRTPAGKLLRRRVREQFAPSRAQ